jgi:hypothetical protein
MSLSRRRLLWLSFVLPVGALVGTVAKAHDRITRGMAARVRPSPSGTSAARCAMCGAGGHTMLDDACPARRRVR